jgi:protein KRI1
MKDESIDAGKVQVDKKVLFDSDDDDESLDATDTSVTINRKFARDYQARKAKQELRQARHNDMDEDIDSETTSSSEDEAAELLTTELDVEIWRTINAVRARDKRIYNPQTRFFPSPFETTTSDGDDSVGDENKADKYQSKSKPKHYKDVVREQILDQMNREERGEDGLDHDDESSVPPLDAVAKSRSPHRLAYDATQVELRQAFLESAREALDIEDDDENDIVVAKSKSKAKSSKAPRREDNDRQAQIELEAEIELLRNSRPASDDDAHKLVDHKGEVADGEAFLLDFFKQRPWIQASHDESESGDDVPDEATKSRASTKVGATKDDSVDSDDASLDELDQADEFEAAFNFRFEQAAAQGGGTALSGFEHSNVSYARSDGAAALPTLRRPDDSRKLQRQARKERKAAERKAKEEQLKRLKNAKRQELNAKLQQIQAILGHTGTAGEESSTLDEAAIMKLLEGDFDPDQFEELMAATYNDVFYQQPDPEWTDDMAVRESLLKLKGHDDNGVDDVDVIIGPDNVDGGLYDNQDEVDHDEPEEADFEEEEYVEEEEYDDDPDQEEDEITKKVKAKINEELYKLDYEDIVAGIPTRFKYRQVTPNNYGLTTSEILCSRDSTLKQFVSLKKLAPYAEREYHVSSRQRRKFRERLKQEMQEQSEQLPESAAADFNAEEATEKKKRRRRLKKGSKSKGERDTVAQESAPEMDTRPEGMQLAVHGQTVTKGKDQKEPSDLNRGDVSKPKDASKRKRSKKKEASLAPSEANRLPHLDKHTNVDAERKRRKKSKTVEGVTASRLASYGL